jgi:arsenate reductase-like glutaredoxin family protein
MHKNDRISLATSARQLILIYNSDTKNHREIFAYATSADKNMLALDISKTKVAGTVWTEVADLMGVRVRDLIKTDHANFVSKYGSDHDIDCDGAIKFLQNDPEMLVFPIIIQGDRAKEVELYGHVQDFYNTDTSAIDIP